MTIFFFLSLFLLAGLIGFIASRPSEFRIERCLHMAAPPSKIFPHINSPKNFNVWNPWAKIDPDAKNTFEGPAEGVGSIMRWEGNSNVGKGDMTAIQSRPPEFIQYRMEFLKPLRATNMAEFTLETNGDQAKVTWAMYGKNSFMGKAINLIMDCDKMVGSQFEKGLADLKAIVEAS